MVVDKYILYFNQRDFTRLAQLFTESGILAPPFEQQIVGRKAIYHYLQSTVQATFEPILIESKQFRSARTQVDVYGSFKIDSLTVKTDWTFLLSATGEICLAQVKLRLPLAKLKNLCLQQESFFSLQRHAPYLTNKSCFKVTLQTAKTKNLNTKKAPFL